MMRQPAARRFRPLPFAVLAALAASAVSAIAPAQDVVVARTAVRAAIDGGAATTVIEQTFANRGERPAEARWLLPLPEGAIADDLRLRVGDDELRAEVLDAGAARRVYEDIVRSRRDPALLEYVGDGLLQARVFPIPPHGEATLTVRLRQALPLAAGLGEWALPLRALRLSLPHTGPIGVDVTLRAATALKTVVPSRQDAEVVYDGECAARVTFEIAPDAPVERDLRVLFGLAETEFGLHALTYRRPGEDGWLQLFVSPRRALPPEAVPPRCVQFVLDTSGSMKGQKLRQAKAALRAFLGTLRPQDRFQIVPFATEARPLFPAPRPADFAALSAAQRGIDALQARGGTNIGDALAAAFAGVQEGKEESRPGELSLIVFVTDGRPTVGTTDARLLLRLAGEQDGGGSRLFVFGVGDDVDRGLLQDLAAAHRGTCDAVAEGEPIDRKTTALCARIREPALTDVTVACDGVEGFELTPRRVPDLFAGDTLQLVGRYRGTGTHEVVLRGALCGAVQEYRFPVVFPTVDTRRDAVPVAWAQRQIEVLLREQRRHPSAELANEVRRLAREYGVTTPFTSQLIVEEGVRLAGGPAKGPCAPSRGGGGYRGPGDAPPPGGGSRGSGGPGGAGPTAPGPASETWGALGTASDEFFLGAPRRTGGREAPVTRRAAGRTFLRVGSRWIETGLPDDWAAQSRRVLAFSDDYFALLQAHPELRAALALGVEVVLRLGDGIVHTVAES
ncbi:MAG: VWA domain-containing protein [Planctomycetota bacterium]